MFSLFRSFVPLFNPVGFGAADFLELLVAALLAAALIGWPFLAGLARRLAARTTWCMIALAILPIALRLALLPWHPVPTSLGADDSSFLLLGDTLAHFRLANPPHPMHRFFETLFVLQEPSYSSIYSLGQGLLLAFGKLLFGLPWAGVALSVGALAALTYWMLRAWMPPIWALLGGLFAAIQFGPLSMWMNTYWGGALAGCAGCLVFGALPRVRECWRARGALLLGLGFAIHMLTRPFETVILALCLALYFLPLAWRRQHLRAMLKAAAVALLVVAAAAGLILLDDKRVTGHWTTLPYALSRYRYGVPCTFTFQPNAVPHGDLTGSQQAAWQYQTEMHGPGTDTPGRYVDRLFERVRFYRFFFLPALYLALPFFLWRLREPRFRYVLLTALLFALGSNLYPYFYAHYIAGITCLFVLMSVAGLEQLSRMSIAGRRVGYDAARVIVALCGVHFVFWYGVQFFPAQPAAQRLMDYSSWDAINYGDPDGRLAVAAQLASQPGRQLVFVHYGPEHKVAEWVYNEADIDAARVVWARDLGPQEDDALRRYYPQRTAWVLEPDARLPELVPYSTYMESLMPPPAPATQPAAQPGQQHQSIMLENVK